MNSIQVKKEFPASIDDVFALMSKHATYNIA
ncbi:MAG: SRPBCC family protein, partial [Acinetobacter sp.]